MGERSDVVDLMCSADVLVFCSESEAMGWVIVEAMAVGLPVVTSNAEGPTEIVSDSKTGLLVQIGDVSGYTRAIRFLLENREEAKEMAAKARLMVERRFHARVMANATAALYQRVLDRL